MGHCLSSGASSGAISARFTLGEVENLQQQGHTHAQYAAFQERFGRTWPGLYPFFGVHFLMVDMSFCVPYIGKNVRPKLANVAGAWDLLS